MLRHSLSLFALTALVSAAAATPAAAGSCCGCAHTCAPPAPAQVQIWGLQPSYVVNQGPVYSGPGFYTSPTYEGEVATVDYPYVGFNDPYDRGPYDPFRHQLYNPYWPHLPPEHGRRFGMHHWSETSVIYHRGFGPRAITMSSAEHWGAHGHRGYRDLRFR
ncbi:MAG TPA: hypothetical protein VIY51_21815 [Xanthobacteraceae bacterium]